MMQIDDEIIFVSTMYEPPYTVSTTALSDVSEITLLLEKHKELLRVREALKLRRQSAVHSVCSTLAIEGSRMTEDQVENILAGKDVLAAPREVQEVRNALDAYALFPELNPYTIDDLLRVHGVMMRGICDSPGQFRRSGVGVFSGSQVVHMAPPAERVPFLVQDLFAWLSRADVSAPICSYVFHYEFEFIHPFTDGNGRLGRFWQSLILASFHPVFAYLPVENLVYQRRAEYYVAISQSTEQTNCAPFIDFMLAAIRDALIVHIRSRRAAASSRHRTREQSESRILSLLRARPTLTVAQLAAKLKLSERTVARHLSALHSRNLISRTGSTKRPIRHTHLSQ